MTEEGKSAGAFAIECKKCAIVLVSLQNDFVKQKGALYKSMAFSGPNFLATINQVLTAARKTGIQVMHAPQDSLELYKPINNTITGHLQSLVDAKALMSKSWGVNPAEDLMTEDDLVIKGRKGMDAFAGTNLTNVLQNKEINTVVIMGVTANGGVYSTACSAYTKGYNVYTLVDGTASFTTDEQRGTEVLLKQVSRTCSTRQFIDMIMHAVKKDEDGD